MATAASFLRSAACQLSAKRPDCRAASIRTSARASARVRGLTYPAYAEGVDGDESMNLQLHHVVADITGATGLRIIRAILAGEHDPKLLARLRDYRCHASAETIEKA